MQIEPSIDPSQLPPWVVAALSLYIILLTYSKIKQVVVDDVIPLFYNQEQIRERNRRRRFADHIETSIRRMNNQESWNDQRFTELEAEVELEGKWQSFSWIPFMNQTKAGTRREKTLTKALQISKERLILIEGDPGSGKSVALRHVTIRMASKAANSRSTKSIIPLYINLKHLERDSGDKINGKLIENFIIRTLTNNNEVVMQRVVVLGYCNCAAL